jgi:hypothetical protein
MQQPKRVPDSAITGQLGVSIVERTLLDMGLLWHPTGQVEAGIDGFVELRDAATGEVSGSIIVVQVKATQQDFPREAPDSFEWPCTKRDLDYWLHGNAPVVLIVVRPRTNEAYWIPVKEYFRDLTTRAKGKIVFDRARHRFNVPCKNTFLQLAIPREVGIYRPPQLKPEVLYLNVLPVAPPAWLYVARTEYRDHRELLAAMRQDKRNCGIEWLLKNKCLISVHDPSEQPFSPYCDVGTVERHNRAEWERDLDSIHSLSKLLSLCLRQKARQHVIRYSPSKECLYFSGLNPGTSRRLTYRGLRSETEREVVAPRRWKKDPTRLAYCRHSAMQWQFQFIGGSWYLEITPTYYFTHDGAALDPFCDERVKRLKEKEKNAAVLGQLIMWTDILTRRGDMFVESYPYLQFGKLETLEFDHGIEDANWLEHETDVDKKSAQTELEFL